MLPSSGRFIVPVFVYLVLFLASVEAHDVLLQQRSHVDINLRRVMKKRAPLPQDSPVVGAAPVPVLASPAKSESSTSTTSTTSSTTSTVSSFGTFQIFNVLTTTSKSTSTGRSVESSSASTSSSSSSSSSSSGSAKSASSVISSSSSESFSFPTDVAAGGVSTSFAPPVTQTSSVAASQSFIPDKQGNTSNSAKSTTLTVIIAIAASIGGIFIIWTIFRKWKLSSSKEFDRRLNPITDWQPTINDDNDDIPGHGRPRPPSIASSFHSSAHGHNSNHAPSSHGHSNPFEDFEGPANSSIPVGGYADLARGSSPTQMQEHQQYAPSVNHSTTPVPLHHQGAYGAGY